MSIHTDRNNYVDDDDYYRRRDRGNQRDYGNGHSSRRYVIKLIMEKRPTNQYFSFHKDGEVVRDLDPGLAISTTMTHRGLLQIGMYLIN